MSHSQDFTDRTVSTEARALPGRIDAEGRGAIALAALAYSIEPEDIFAPTRLRARVAIARQVAMYVSHVTLGLSLAAVGRRFGRDRTTAAHACRLVEDLRDDVRFDYALSHLEAAVLKLATLSRAA
jgi:chromosomal replication initiation ATPase DnaA